MLRRPVEQPQGLGPRRGIELARPRPDLDPCFDRPEPQIPPHGVARDLELARDAFGAPSSPVQLADLANHLGVDHRHLRSRWCHARRLCRHVSSSLGPGGRGGYGRRCFVKPLVTFLARRARNRDPSCSSRTTVDDDVLPVTGAASIRRRIVLSHNGVLTGGPTTRARSVRRSDAQERDAHPGVDHDALVEDMIKDLDNTTVRAGPLDGHSLHLRVAPGRGTNADAPMMHSRCLDLRTISVRTCGRNGELPCPR